MATGASHFTCILCGHEAAATRGSAQALALTEVGSVSAGAVADLLVIDGDPSLDVRMLLHPQRIWMVIQGGNVVAGRPRGRELSAA